jgi:hypothetical protein
VLVVWGLLSDDPSGWLLAGSLAAIASTGTLVAARRSALRSG